MNETFRTRGSTTSASPISESWPVTTESTLSGSPASRKHSASRSAVSAVSSAGLSTTAFPTAGAGAILWIGSRPG